jgi:AmmeMemoRadiSam system protein B
MSTDLDIRPSPIVGQWYPGDPQRLAKSVDSYIEGASPVEVEGEVIAVIAPHAGHVYSGPVAGYAFAALKDMSPELVVVASPMHHYYSQPLLTSAHNAYQTPLGTIRIDRETMQALNQQIQTELGFGITSVPHDPEHSLEIELPFLQRALNGDFRLIPIMVRDQSARVASALGHALGKILQGRNAVLVASTDLSHFYPQSMANLLDSEILRRVEQFDPEGVLQAEDEGKGFACGKAALAAVLWASKDLGANTVKILHHATSGDVTGDYERVVGYGAAVITRKTMKEHYKE